MIGPIMNPMPHTAIARPRCPSGKISHRMACESGMIGPPPMPWKMRARIRKVRFGRHAGQHRADREQRAQIRKKRLRPSTPASQPVAGMMTALAAR